MSVCTRVWPQTSSGVISGAVLAVIALAMPSPAAAQFIERVEIERTVGADKSTAFVMTIHGDGFGTERTNLVVAVLPLAGVTQPPAVTQATAKAITTQFTATETYWPNIVSLVTAGGFHDSFRLPAIDRAVLLAPRGSTAAVETFGLRIHGSGFMEGNTKVTLSPPPIDQPTIDRVAERGTVLEAHFRAGSGYRPESLAVTVGSGETIQYTIPADDGPPDGADREVFVYRGLLPPKVVSDMFGKRIAKRFMAIKAIITNRNRDFDLLLHDLTLDLTRIRRRWTDPDGLADRMKEGEILVSATELELLRGVAEKGRTFDPRNVTLHILQGTGLVAAGLIGVVDTGTRFAKYVATFNGPFLAAYETVFPDHTVSNLNRLNDSAFAPNTLIPRRQARTFVLFVPQDLFLTKKEQDRFWKEPTELFDDETADLDLRLAEVFADVIFIAEADSVTGISLTQIDISVAERKKAQRDKPEIRGVVVGRNLQGAQLQLIAPAGATLTPDGAASDTRLPFVLRANAPLDPSVIVQIEVAKGASHATVSTRLDYAPDPPEITDIKPAFVVAGAAAPTAVEIIGTGFIPGLTTLRVAGANVTVSDVVVQSGVRITANISAAAAAALGNRDVTAVNAERASAAKPLAIRPPAPTIGKIDPREGKAAPGLPIEIAGTNFVPGGTKLSIAPDAGVTLTLGDVTATSIKATLAIDAAAAAGVRDLKVTTAGGEVATKFEVKK